MTRNLLLLSLALGFCSSPALANTPLCNGVAATIVGTPLNDTIVGTSGVDIIVALAGDDDIDGGGGDDIICGGSGIDTITGGAGNDWIDGEDGDDVIKGAQDDDIIFGGTGADTIRGSKGDDTIDGGGGDDSIDGGWGNDTIKGGPDNDTIDGNLGDDVMRGSKGDDHLDGGEGDDNLHGGWGNDYVKGGPDNDTVIGGWGDDTLRGSRGDDFLDGGPGNDHLNGGVHEIKDECVLEASDTDAPFACEMMNGCDHEVSGITTNSGTPLLIDSVTGTVIFANFFNGSAISNGTDRSVSVCVSPENSQGNRFAHFTTNVGQDDNTIIKAYPEFIIGSKFGIVGETSFRPYPALVSSTGFQYPNLEIISDVVGLPEFTNDLPNIDILLDIDEHNVVGAIRDVMLESWFFDTSLNATSIGDGTDGTPLAGSINNIVGIGHPDGGDQNNVELRNILLEMMVHIGPLDPDDVSGTNRNPASHRLPIEPVSIGQYQYSIWYGDTYLAPLVVFSRETMVNNQTGTNLSAEGEIQLNWNDFLEFTLNDLEAHMQAAGVTWATGSSNPFPAMRSASGAVSGLEFGVEAQTNNPVDAPYAATVRKFEVWISGKNFGL